jgi:hypothetical protein
MFLPSRFLHKQMSYLFVYYKLVSNKNVTNKPFFCVCKKATGFLVSVNSNFISLVCPHSVLIRSTAKVHIHDFVYECFLVAMPWPVAMATFLTTHSITLFIVSVPGSTGPTTHIALPKLTDCLPSQTALIKIVLVYGEWMMPCRDGYVAVYAASLSRVF